jgi:hypothetical protein
MNKSSKGKQATRGEKQILEENRQTVDFYFYVFLISNVTYLTLRYVFFWSTFTAKFIFLYAFTASLSSGAYYFISYVGRPVKDEAGVIVGAGSDLNLPGHISEYAKDVVLFAAICYALTLVSDYFWLTLLVVPCYVFYKLWVNFLGPWFFAPAPETDADQDGNQKKPKEKRKIIRR